ncbi:MAG: hypothetical protein QOF78_2855, partial [Phycisphaerales bacterium]|nr:hypothetical protein [Phycisphaerales bacterium]
EITSFGRFRFTSKYPIGPTVGYDYTQILLDGRRIALPASNLVDFSIGAGSPVAPIGAFGPVRRGFLGVSAGLGYAGDEPFANDNAWYAKGSLMMGGEIDANTSVIALIEFDGNRGIFPDLPMLGFGYAKTVSPELEYVVGTFMYLNWQPRKDLTFEVLWEPIYDLSVSLEYEMHKGWKAYVSYASIEEAFTVEELPRNRRLFYTEQQAEMGINWEPSNSVSMLLAGGYAFERQFSSGWDDRSLTRIADLDDAPYARVEISLRF